MPRRFKTLLDPTPMNGTFDIFLRKEDGSFEWTGGTETLALARGKVVQNPASVDYVFFIVNEATGEKTLIEPPLISLSLIHI